MFCFIFRLQIISNKNHLTPRNGKTASEKYSPIVTISKISKEERFEECVYCGQVFSHKVLLKHKAEEEKFLKCKYCDKDFENVYLYRRHTYRYHKYYTCKTCNLKFLKGAYEYHMSSVHKQKSVCQVCNKTFSTNLSLSAHRKKIHLGLREERFQCQICQYKAPNNFQYKVHIARHKKSPFLVCEHCGSGHYTNTELRTHIQADHCGGFPCMVCKKSFRSQEYLNKHKISHEDKCGTTRRNFSCEECGKVFLNESKLRNHCLQHKDQLAILTCDTCGKTVTSKAILEAHMKTHTEIKSFSCLECGKSFANKKHLVGHKHLCSSSGK